MEKVKVGIIGCGVISGTYLNACKRFPIMDVVALADLDVERAKARANEFGIPKACTVEELLADPEIRIVINLTIPRAHGEVCIAALQAGKNVYVEKPLAVTREEGRQILKLAEEKGLLAGGAPDTFLGGGIQTCRKLIDDGAIGQPIAIAGNMICGGHESWHPDPAFYYDLGGGPLFDMGPYYLTAFVNLIGPIKRIASSATVTFEQRTITSKPKYGQKIDVKTPTHISGVVNFANGVVGTLTTSFDIPVSPTDFNHRIEIYGTEGALKVPDPNSFGGPVYIRRKDRNEWEEVQLTHGFIGNSRGVGVVDMAQALLSGRPHRASGQLAFHVLDAMHAFLDSSREGKHITLQSSCERPAPFPIGLPDDAVDQ